MTGPVRPRAVVAESTVRQLVGVLLLGFGSTFGIVAAGAAFGSRGAWVAVLALAAAAVIGGSVLLRPIPAPAEPDDDAARRSQVR